MEDANEKAIVIETDLEKQTITKSEKPLVIWEAPSLPTYKSSKVATIIFILAFLAVLFVSAITANYSTFAVFISIAILLLVLNSTEQKIVENRVYEDRVTSDGKEIFFDELKSFAIDYDKYFKELTLFYKKKWWISERLQVGSSDPNVLRSVFSEFLPEERSHKNILDKIARMIKIN